MHRKSGLTLFYVKCSESIYTKETCMIKEKSIILFRYIIALTKKTNQLKKFLQVQFLPVRFFLSSMK